MIELIRNFFSVTHEAEVYFLLLAILILGIALGIILRRTILKIIIRLRRGREKGLNKKAVRLISKIGYTGIEENVAGKGHIRWNGQFVVSHLTIDLLANKEEEIHGFIIKSGEDVNPEQPATRRELLDIFVNFELDKLFLINMNTMKINKVEFVLNPANIVLPEEESIKTWHWILIGLAFGYILAKAISF